MFENVRRDLERAMRANQGGETGAGALIRELWSPGTQAILVHRFGHWANGVRWYPLRLLLRLVHFPIQYFFSWRVGIYIPVNARIGPGLVIHTWGGGVTFPEAPIGRDVTVIGGGVQFDYSTRSIGDNVTLGPGTKGIGKIRIGDRVRTGPNCVIQDDVPDDCVVFGNPGRIMGPLRTERAAPAGVPAEPGAASDASASSAPPPAAVL